MYNNVKTDERTTLCNLLETEFISRNEIRVSAEVYTTNPNLPRIYGDCIITRSFLNEDNLNSRLLSKIKQNSQAPEGFIFYVGSQWKCNARRVPVLVFGSSIVGLRISGINEGPV